MQPAASTLHDKPVWTAPLSGRLGVRCSVGGNLCLISGASCGSVDDPVGREEGSTA